MVTKPIDSQIKKDMAYGQRAMLTTTPDADMKQDTDFNIGGFCIAWRRRRPKITEYGELSIRYQRRNGAKTEYQKILDGESRAHLFIFEFPETWVMCSGPAMLKALQNNVGYVGEWNRDGKTKAYYIPLKNIPHVLLTKNEK